jgi:hypothetical protein
MIVGLFYLKRELLLYLKRGLLYRYNTRLPWTLIDSRSLLAVYSVSFDTLGNRLPSTLMHADRAGCALGAGARRDGPTEGPPALA